MKSVGGERLTSAPVSELGLLGDRGWGIFDVDTSTVLTARRTPELLFASARLTEASADQGSAEQDKAAIEVELTLPDESKLSSTDGAATNAALSHWLGRAVELRRAGDEGGTYEVPLDFENDAEWVSWQGPGGAWHDSQRSRLSLVSRTTMGEWDPRRFRTNVILELTDGEASEDELVGHTISLGGTRLDITKQIDRCVIVTRPQPGIDRDLDVLRTINAERATLLSVGALVAEGGQLSVGDVTATG